MIEGKEPNARRQRRELRPSSRNGSDEVRAHRFGKRIQVRKLLQSPEPYLRAGTSCRFRLPSIVKFVRHRAPPRGVAERVVSL